MTPVNIKYVSLIFPEIVSQDNFLDMVNGSSVIDRSKSSRDLSGFKAAQHVSDRRILKAVSHRDGYGLAAVEQVKSKSDAWDNHDPERSGVFVGACPSSVTDNENYIPAVKACVDTSGQYIEGHFGGQCMRSRPTTLLLGLPNNVLCYASLILDARGPNNNFTAGGVSSLMALASAKRSLTRGRLDRAVAGGYTYDSDPVRQATLKKLNVTKNEDDVVFTDCASFAELSLANEDKGLQLVDMRFATSDEFGSEDFENQYFRILQELINDHGITAKDVQSLFVPFASWLDNSTDKYHKIREVFPKDHTGLYSLEDRIGFAGETSGMAELALLEMSAHGEAVKWENIGETPEVQTHGGGQRYQLITAISFDGDIAVALTKS